MAFFQYLKFDGLALPLPVSYEVEVSDVEADNRVVARYPEIRNMIYDYILKVGELNRANTGDKKILGEWHFIPEEIAEPLIEADMDLIF